MRKQPSWLLTALLIAAVLANLRWHNAGIGLTFGVFYFLWCAWLAGGVLAPNEPRRWQLVAGLVGNLALLTVVGTAAYWLFRLNGTVIAVIAIVTPCVWLTLPHAPGRPGSPMWQRDPLRGLPRTMGVTTFLLLGFIGLLALAIRQLLGAQTTEAIRTPWQIVPPSFWVGFIGATMALLGLHLRTDRAGRRLLLTLLLLGVGTSVALSVYPLGYGYDPFIHQAAERTIAESGVITPKTPYYIGQYALVVPIARILGVDVVAVDRVSSLAGLLLIAALAYWPWRRYHPTAAALPLTLLLLPLGSLIATTPQGMANLWLLATATIVALPWTPVPQPPQLRWLPIALLTAGAASATHPIAGVPALALVAFGLIAAWRPATSYVVKWGPRLASGAVFGLTATTLPLLFLLNAQRAGIAPSEAWEPQPLGQMIAATAAAALPRFPVSTDPLLDFAAVLDLNRGWLLAVGAAAGAWLAWSRKKQAVLLPSVATSIALLTTYLALRQMRFPQLIADEQAVFGQRVLELAGFVLLPLLMAGAQMLLERMSQERVLRAAVVVLGSATLAAAVYLNYPRVDRYRVDRGYNLSAADVAAVRLVAADAHGTYLVLANQMTSAAAIREFGFAPAYPTAADPRRTMYTYPVPTGEPLYQKFLAMVREGPERSVVQTAAALSATPINTVYFILPHYWNDFDRTSAAAQAAADQWWPLDNGKILVFRYDLGR
ncbi:MAG: hypothetical protein Q7S23_00655 [bacterium]|nr:hypothetical protein [bacterium]